MGATTSFSAQTASYTPIGVWGTSSEIGYVIGFQPRLGHCTGLSRPVPVFVTPNNNRPAQPQSTSLPRPPSTGDLPLETSDRVFIWKRM